MARFTYGGTSADWVGDRFTIRPGVDVFAASSGAPIDVRRADTKSILTDVIAPVGWNGSAFPMGRALSDRGGFIRFQGPDGLAVPVEVRIAATASTVAGEWFGLVGQPPQILSDGQVAGYVTESELAEALRNAAIGNVDTSNFVTASQLQMQLAMLPQVPDVTNLVTANDARSIAQSAVNAALAAYVPPQPDLTSYARSTDVETLRSALAALLLRVEDLEDGRTPVDPPADAYSDTYTNAY